jgi:hypothetical protein
MENKESPLRKYRRQPKLYLTLPSNGKWYDNTIVADGTYTDLAVFSMTASDEILYKTPDALINGEATVKNINSCIPAIINPWEVKTLDLDAILVAVRMASYGENMAVNARCRKCGEENTYDVGLQKYLDYFSTRSFESKLQYNDFTLHLEPLSYRRWSELQKQQMSYQRALNLNVSKIDDEEQKEKYIQELIDKINETLATSVLEQVTKIEVDGEAETNRSEIYAFLEEQEVGLFHAIKKLIEKNTEQWKLPLEKTKCESCGNEEETRISLDTSDFFAQG